jgi:hypothetical protein
LLRPAFTQNTVNVLQDHVRRVILIDRVFNGDFDSVYGRVRGTRGGKAGASATASAGSCDVVGSAVLAEA